MAGVYENLLREFVEIPNELLAAIEHGVGSNALFDQYILHGSVCLKCTYQPKHECQKVYNISVKHNTLKCYRESMCPLLKRKLTTGFASLTPIVPVNAHPQVVHDIFECPNGKTFLE